MRNSLFWGFLRQLWPEIVTGSEHRKWIVLEMTYKSCTMINIIPKPNHYHHKIKWLIFVKCISCHHGIIGLSQTYLPRKPKILRNKIPGFIIGSISVNFLVLGLYFRKTPKILGCQKSAHNNLEGFQFKKLEIKEIHTGFAVSITHFSNHLK